MSSTTQLRTIAAALAAVLLATAAGCGNDSDDNGEDGDATASPTTEVADETTTTTVAAEGPEEWVEVVRELYKRDLALLEAPDPDAVQDLYSPACECYQARYDTVSLLAQDEEHVEGEPTAVLFVKHENTTGDTFTDLTIKIQARPLRIVDADGNEVQEFAVDEQTACLSLTVVPDGPDGAWRIHTKLPLTGCPEGS